MFHSLTMMTRGVAGRTEIEVLLQSGRTRVLMRRKPAAITLAESSGKERGVGKGWRRTFRVLIRVVEKVTREPSICIAIN